MREIYLAGFEIAVKEAQPWTLMCSYNQINGIYASDNQRLMSDIPRGEWGYEGAIMTDWGAMNDRVQAIRAGLDLEMPGPCDENEKQVLDAVAQGLLSEAELDACAERIAALLLLAQENTSQAYDADAHDELGRRVARESAVLLKLGRALPAGKECKSCGDRQPLQKRRAIKARDPVKSTLIVLPACATPWTREACRIHGQPAMTRSSPSRMRR